MKMRMKRISLVVIILILTGLPAFAGAGTKSGAANFSLVPHGSATVSDSGLSFGAGFSKVNSGGNTGAASGRGTGFLVDTGREFGTAHSSSAGQYVRQPLVKPVSTKTQGSILLGIGTAMIIGGAVLYNVAENSDNEETKWGAGVGSVALLGLGGLAIYKGLALLILGDPNERAVVSGRKGIPRRRGGIRAGVKLSF
jgi:hypothetical protein